MESRYLYRAKRIDNGEWEIGSLIALPDGKFEIANKCENPPDGDPMWRKCVITHYVDPSTICQCTGLEDENSKLIWENDIVKFEDCGKEGYEYKEDFEYENTARVEFADGRWSLTDFASDNSAVMDTMYDHADFMDLWQACKVIGNKFDNPELLEV